jgi:acetyl-CoA decarbonylase/synthase complex subunit gamma
VRWGLGRYDYRVEPGLYAVGRPDADSPVLVTANYKLSLDTLRRELAGLDVFVLVLETMGINVWCAAGKGTFGTDELCDRIEAVGLDRVVSHRRLVLPQLGAPGVAAHLVKQRTGFRVKYGPVEARDLPRFLAEGRASAEMRRKRFSLRERAALVPMELLPALKYALPLIAALALFAALLGPAGSPLANLLVHGVAAAVAVLAGVFSGAVVTPLLLPWMPGRAFAAKGAVAGVLGAAPVSALATWSLVSPGGLRWLDGLGLVVLAVALASFLAMNFTGASTYTSRSGVEKEMRWAVPLQTIAAAAGLVGWGLAVALLR